MPYHLELGSDGYKYKDKAIVVNSMTGKHHSLSPIPIAKAQAQKRILEQKDDPPMDSDSFSDSDHRPRKFIQSVVGSEEFRKGAFTAKAKKHGMSSLEFMREVLEHPNDYDIRTRRQAQFLHNIQRK